MAEQMQNCCTLGTEPTIERLFSIGEVVMLRSGGPLLTVAAFPDPTGKVECLIYIGDDPKWSLIPQHCLKHASWWKRFWNT
jgi:uncharacterized protein YodC (DUF2158 family)